MTVLLLTIFLGFFGVYRFYKKQYGLGVLYIFTGGLFGVGWIIDIVSAVKECNIKNTSGDNVVIKCSHCGKEVAEGTKTCSGCGGSLFSKESIDNGNGSPKKKISKKTIIIIVVAVICVVVLAIMTSIKDSEDGRVYLNKDNYENYVNLTNTISGTGWTTYGYTGFSCEFKATGNDNYKYEDVKISITVNSDDGVSKASASFTLTLDEYGNGEKTGSATYRWGGSQWYVDVYPLSSITHYTITKIEGSICNK